MKHTDDTAEVEFLSIQQVDGEHVTKRRHTWQNCEHKQDSYLNLSLS